MEDSLPQDVQHFMKHGDLSQCLLRLQILRNEFRQSTAAQQFVVPIILQHQLTAMDNSTTQNAELSRGIEKLITENVLRKLRLPVTTSDYILLFSDDFIEVMSRSLLQQMNKELKTHTFDLPANLHTSLPAYLNENCLRYHLDMHIKKEMLEGVIRTYLRNWDTERAAGDVGGVVGDVHPQQWLTYSEYLMERQKCEIEGKVEAPIDVQERRERQEASVGMNLDEEGKSSNGECQSVGGASISCDDTPMILQGFGEQSGSHREIRLVTMRVESVVYLIFKCGILRNYTKNSYCFTFPQMGKLCTFIQKGRNEIIDKLKRKKFKEMLQTEFDKVELRSSSLTNRFHLLDLIGKEMILPITTSSGVLLQLCEELKTASNKKRFRSF